MASTVEFVNTVMADHVVLLPGAERLDGRRLTFTTADMLTAYRTFRAAVALAPPV